METCHLASWNGKLLTAIPIHRKLTNRLSVLLFDYKNCHFVLQSRSTVFETITCRRGFSNSLDLQPETVSSPLCSSQINLLNFVSVFSL